MVGSKFWFSINFADTDMFDSTFKIYRKSSWIAKNSSWRQKKKSWLQRTLMTEKYYQKRKWGVCSALYLYRQRILTPPRYLTSVCESIRCNRHGIAGIAFYNVIGLSVISAWLVVWPRPSLQVAKQNKDWLPFGGSRVTIDHC